MPPRCPECGRFLSTDFVDDLRAAPAACPRCEVELTADRFSGGEAASEPGAVGEPGTPPTSVRPPDLPPDDFRAVVGRDDVLAGWDEGPSGTPSVEGPVVASALAVLAGGVLGGLIGGLSSRRHRSLGTVVGTLLGALAALAGSRALGPPGPP